MDELLINTPGGNTPLNPEVAQKYHVKPGTLSPFSRRMVVDAQGKVPPPEKKPAPALDEQPRGGRLEGIAQMDMGLELKTSEMIDFAQGADSTLHPERFPQ